MKERSWYLKIKVETFEFNETEAIMILIDNRSNNFECEIRV